jgi:hypothetical protein
MTSTLLRNKFQALIYRKAERTKEANNFAFGRKIGFMAKLFGCRHGDMGRPFANGETAYRTCLKCGARRQFNTQTLETHGNFYFPTVIKADSADNI